MAHSEAAQPIRVMLVDDDQSMCRMLERAIRATGALSLVAVAHGVEEAKTILAAGAETDVLLVDLGLPDGNGLELIGWTVARQPGVDVIVVTVFGDEDHIFAALRAGATGYLLKESTANAVLDAINLVRQGGAAITPVIARRIIKRLQPQASALRPGVDVNVRLTQREVHILTLVSKGYLSQEIADLLGLSRHTVFAHIKKIYRKLMVNNRTEAVHEALQRGLISH